MTDEAGGDGGSSSGDGSPEAGWSGGRMEPSGEAIPTADVNSSYPYQHPSRTKEPDESSGTYDVQSADFLTPTLDLTRESSSSPPPVVRPSTGVRRQLREEWVGQVRRGSTWSEPAARRLVPVLEPEPFEIPKSVIPWWVWGLVCVLLAAGFIVLFGEAK